MHSKTIEQLQYFVGKVCTVLTSPVNREFDELRAREHFVLRVGAINLDGIWGTHPGSGMTSFFQWSPSLIGICEEIELDPNNPEHAQMIEQYEKQTGQKIKSDISSPVPTKKKEKDLVQLKEPPKKQTAPDEQVPFVDISNLEKLAAQTKMQYDQYDSVRDKLSP